MASLATPAVLLAPKGGYSRDSVSTEANPLPKKIIICCDGSWQNATSLDPKDGCSSNVARLSRVLANAGAEPKRKGIESEPDKVWQQIVYYDAGIGTKDAAYVDRMLQGATGEGLNENIVEAYNFIVNNYAAGDKLYFFGFSRGAYIVRAVAGLACHIGVLKPSFISAFIECYAAYLDRSGNGLKEQTPFSTCKPWKDFLKRNQGVTYTNCSASDVVVEVIGVWDTVASFGWPDIGHFMKIHKADPSVYACYDTELHPQIKHAYQALALDEKRGPFFPEVWKLKVKPAKRNPDGTPIPATKDEKPKTHLVQCWFPGAHVNIGGGNSNNTGPSPTGDREQLASISYAWMLDRIQPYLALSQDALQCQLAEFKARAVPTKPQTGEKTSGLDNIGNKGQLPHPNTAAGDENKSSESEGFVGRMWRGVGKVVAYLPKVPDLGLSALVPNVVRKTIGKGSAYVTQVGYAIGAIDDSYTAEYKAAGFPVIRTPGQYHPKYMTQEGPDGMVEITTERIHPSVHYRQLYERKELGKKEGEIYQPISMSGWERVSVVDGVGKDFRKRDGYQWVLKNKDGKIERALWEFEIGDMPQETSIEWALIKDSWVKDVHEEAKKQWALN